jgi:flagellar protein FlbT
MARQLIDAFSAATTSALARDILARALAAAESDDCYQALKLVRRVIRHEDAVLGRAMPHAGSVQRSQEPVGTAFRDTAAR